MRETICVLHEIDSHDAVGGKARGLTKLIAAGLPVPAGFVAMPDATDGEIVAAYRRLGAGPVAVRSSAEEEQTWDSTLLEAMSVSTSMANRLLGTLLSMGAEPDATPPTDAAALAVTGDIESLEPVRRLAALAEWLRGPASCPAKPTRATAAKGHDRS